MTRHANYLLCDLNIEDKVNDREIRGNDGGGYIMGINTCTEHIENIVLYSKLICTYRIWVSSSSSKRPQSLGITPDPFVPTMRPSVIMDQEKFNAIVCRSWSKRLGRVCFPRYNLIVLDLRI